MTEQKELVVFEEGSALEMFKTEGGLNPVLNKLAEIARSYKWDISTEDGRKELAKFGRNITSSKTYIEGVGKKLSGEAKKVPKLIDSERKRAFKFCEDLKAEIEKPLTDWTNKENERTRAHEKNMGEIYEISDMYLEDKTSSEVGELLIRIQKIVIDNGWEEYEEKAISAVEATINILIKARDKKAEQEIEKAELEQFRKEKEVRDAKEEADRMAKEAEALGIERKKAEDEIIKIASEQRVKEAELARQKAEQDKKDYEKRVVRERKEAKEKAEREKIEYQQRVDAERAEAEEKRIRDEEAEKARIAEAQKMREENQEHRRKINNDVLVLLNEQGFNDEQAKKIITLAATKKLGELVINY